MRNEAAVGELLTLLADESMCDDAAVAIQEKGAAAVPELLAALDDDDWQVRAGAVFALSLLQQDALPQLRDLTETEQQESVRDAAVWAIDAIAQTR